MVERGGLENRCAFAGTEGSNPSLSATILPSPADFPARRGIAPSFRGLARVPEARDAWQPPHVCSMLARSRLASCHGSHTRVHTPAPCCLPEIAIANQNRLNQHESMLCISGLRSNSLFPRTGSCWRLNREKFRQHQGIGSAGTGSSSGQIGRKCRFSALISTTFVLTITTFLGWTVTCLLGEPVLLGLRRPLQRDVRSGEVLCCQIGWLLARQDSSLDLR